MVKHFKYLAIKLEALHNLLLLSNDGKFYQSYSMIEQTSENNRNKGILQTHEDLMEICY